MQPRRIYVTERNEITIVCPHCGRLRQGVLKRKRPGHKAIRLRCSCGKDFPVILEFRRHYRKPTRLQGSLRLGETGHSHPIMITDLSLSGLGFITDNSHRLNEGRLLHLTFVLDDPQKSKVRKKAVTRRTDGNFVGCEFVSHRFHHDKALGCYMMP